MNAVMQEQDILVEKCLKPKNKVVGLCKESRNTFLNTRAACIFFKPSLIKTGLRMCQNLVKVLLTDNIDPES